MSQTHTCGTGCINRRTPPTDQHTRPLHPHPGINTATIQLAVADRCTLIASRSHSNRFFLLSVGSCAGRDPDPKNTAGEAGDTTLIHARLSSSQNLPADRWHVLGPSPVTRQHSSTTDGSQERLSGRCSRAAGAYQPATSMPAAQQHHLRRQAPQDSRPWPCPQCCAAHVYCCCCCTLTHTPPSTNRTPAAVTYVAA